jgi:hypothetical protein
MEKKRLQNRQHSFNTYYGADIEKGVKKNHSEPSFVKGRSTLRN